ncbi:hypothetical protein P5V15_004190 [Pogonomyrmex californicus]
MLEDTLKDKHIQYKRLKNNHSSPLISTSSVKTCSSEKKLSLYHEQRQRIIDSDWGRYALDLNLWEDNKSPVVQIRSSEVSLNDREYCGFLSDRLIGIGLSFLKRSPENGLYILSKCVLNNRYLNLSYNFIEHIENLDGLNIKELNLEGNCITSFKSAIPGHGISILPKLRIILLGYNRLSTLGFFKDAYSLRFIDLKFNKITDLLEVLNLKGSIFKVDFRGNTCTKWPNYRNVLISFVPSLRVIDDIEVSVTEKVTSTTLFASPLDLIVVRKVANLMLLEHLNISKIDAHVQPYDEISPPLMILTGPSALKKMALALHVARTIPDKIKYCRWYTTKEMYEDEDERNAYILVNREKFNDMARCGEFLVILDLLGNSYGFHINQISLLISEHKIGLTHMNLYAVTEVSKRYPNVKAILVLTQNVDLHRNWIREKFNVYTWIKDSVENLLAVKIGKYHEKMETASCILNFIREILDEIIYRLEFSIYGISQEKEATTTDIILERTIPKSFVLRRSEDQQVISYEEKAETLKNIYIELVIKNRELYLDYHESHPGFFILVLLMDDYMKAFTSLIDFIHESYTNLPYRKPIFSSEVQHFRNTTILIMLEHLVNEIRENLSISKRQYRKILKL